MVASKPVNAGGAKGGRKLDARGLGMEQQNPGSAIAAKQGRDATSGETRTLRWADASIWTDRMVSALGNGVKACPWAGQGPDPLAHPGYGCSNTIQPK